MIEHRLIEKMLLIMGKELARIKSGSPIDPVFIDTAVDFIRTYADRTHHGKEEDILFKELAAKKLTEEDRRMMDDLVAEHQLARKMVKKLVDAKKRYVSGEEGAGGEIQDEMQWLIGFYPVHIEKEDKVFFPDTERYFPEEELTAMLSEFREFDRKMIHEKYTRLVEDLRNR